MKISCIVASFNRPTFLKEAIRSVVSQTHTDWELIVVDNSTQMDVREVVSEIHLPLEKVRVFMRCGDPEIPPKRNMLGVNINGGLLHATGDLVCYLADDDAFFLDWFQKANDYFETFPYVQVAFGILKYCDKVLDFREMGEIRFWDEIISDPMGRLDQNQVIHRRFDPIVKWPENLGSEMSADGWFFNQLATEHSFHPINAWAAIKRLHGKNLQNHVSLYQSGKMDDLRE